MNDITIVTAFFDIGRGEWSPDKGLPHYLQRTNDTYLKRFGHMAKLENDMIVYTSKEFVDDIKFLRQDRPTKIYTLDFPNSFNKLREEVQKVQRDPEYQAKMAVCARWTSADSYQIDSKFHLARCARWAQGLPGFCNYS